MKVRITVEIEINDDQLDHYYSGIPCHSVEMREAYEGRVAHDRRTITPTEITAFFARTCLDRCHGLNDNHGVVTSWKIVSNELLPE